MPRIRLLLRVADFPFSDFWGGSRPFIYLFHLIYFIRVIFCHVSVLLIDRLIDSSMRSAIITAVNWLAEETLEPAGRQMASAHFNSLQFQLMSWAYGNYSLLLLLLLLLLLFLLLDAVEANDAISGADYQWIMHAPPASPPPSRLAADWIHRLRRKWRRSRLNHVKPAGWFIQKKSLRINAISEQFYFL